MLPTLLLPLLLSPAVQAGPRAAGHDDPQSTQTEAGIDTEISTDHTAYLVRPGQWRLGLATFDYGVTETLQLRTAPALWLLGPNAYGKAKILDTQPVDIALQAGILRVDLSRLSTQRQGVEAAFLAIPLQWWASLEIDEHWTLSLGTGHNVFKVSGGLTGREIGELLGTVAGDDRIGGQLEALGTGLYGSGQLWLHQSRVAVDYRLNQRHSVILQTNNSFLVTGLLTAGASVEDAATGTTAEVGASAQFSNPLTQVPTAASLAWQVSWPRFHLRLGLPLTANPQSLVQAVALYWVLGPKTRSDPTTFLGASTEPGDASPGVEQPSGPR